MYTLAKNRLKLKYIKIGKPAVRYKPSPINIY